MALFKDAIPFYYFICYLKADPEKISFRHFRHHPGHS